MAGQHDTQDSGDIRDHIPRGELAGYCLHALTAAGGLPSDAAARRLVSITLAGLRPAKTHPADTR